MTTIHRALGYVDRSAALAADAPLRVVMATEGRKADGIDLRMAGAKLDRFKASPVLGYGHLYFGRENLPIGRVTPASIRVAGKTLSGDLDFDPEDDFAVLVERKMRAGYISAVSVGFTVLEWEDGKGDAWRGGVATSWELTELSVVPVGMDENALVTAGRDAMLAAVQHYTGQRPPQTVSAGDAARLLGALKPAVDGRGARQVLDSFGRQAGR